jgi:hypothetical protein
LIAPRPKRSDPSARDVICVHAAERDAPPRSGIAGFSKPGAIPKNLDRRALRIYRPQD